LIPGFGVGTDAKVGTFPDEIWIFFLKNLEESEAALKADFFTDQENLLSDL